jgi:hypothetical protein
MHSPGGGDSCPTGADVTLNGASPSLVPLNPVVPAMIENVGDVL